MLHYNEDVPPYTFRVYIDGEPHDSTFPPAMFEKAVKQMQKDDLKKIKESNRYNNARTKKVVSPFKRPKLKMVIPGTAKPKPTPRKPNP